ncbi:hypothetical protein BaRGS_00029121 [Batillaria attramentaria]|uniref:Glutamate receptor ionotropic, kainate 2 n=1 Tax=Batillaria attramentaria TaxID=370345 RepID=A0ABD0JY71_9CAEN
MLHALAALHLTPSRSAPLTIVTGGLFGEDDEHQSVENAFRYAVYRINHDRQLLADTTLTYDIQHVPIDDGFRASKKVCFQAEKNTVAMFGPRSPAVSGFVNSLCASLQIPHLEMRLETEFMRTAHALTLNPGSSCLGNAHRLCFCDGLPKMYDKDIELHIHLIKVQNVIRGEQQRRLEIVVRQVDANNMRSVLKEAKTKKWRNILVDLSVDGTGLFLKMALQEGMIDPYHHYVLTNLDIESIDMEDFRHNYVNLTGFRIVDPEEKHTAAIIKEMEIYELQTDLQLLNTTGYQSLPHEVALMYDAVYLLANALERYDQQTILHPVNASCEFPVQWSSGPTLYAHLNQAGTWRYNTGVNMSHRTDLGGHPFGNKTLIVTSLKPDQNPLLVVTAVKETPFLMVSENPKAKEPFEGFCIDLLNELAATVGFRYRIELVPDGNYGALMDNGEWNGMVREVIDRRADLAVAPLTINYVREQVIDFTKPFLNLGISILFKVPRREKPGLFSFLNPLAVEIWLYVIGAYLLVSFTIFVLARFSPYEWYNPHPCNPDTDEVENTFDLANSFWFTVGTLMQQGSDVNPRAVSTRIVGGIWWFFTLIIISSYTANLAAFLTVERMVSPIEDVEDLAKQTDIAYGTRKSGSTYSFFRDSKIDTYQRLYAFMKEHPEAMMDSYDEGIKRVLSGNGKYAFFMESTMIDYQVQRDCDLMQVGGLLDSKGYGIGTPQNSPYRDKLSMAILELQENGRIQMLYNKWWKDTGTCVRDDDTKGSKAEALGVENVGGIFVVLMAGLALAVIVAVCEFVWKSRKNAKEDRRSLCSEMGQELRFAVRCIGSSKKPRFKRRCSKCKKGTDEPDGVHVCEVPLTDSANGVIQLREVRRSPGTSTSRRFDPEFSRPKDFSGEYLHVDYSDGEA